MSEYRAPIRDMLFVLNELAELDGIAQMPGCEEASADVVTAVLEEASRFAEEVLSPLNRVGDREGARFQDGQVTMPKGFKEAYKLFAESGWTALGRKIGVGRAGLADSGGDTGHRDVEIGKSCVFAVPLAHRRRY